MERRSATVGFWVVSTAEHAILVVQCVCHGVRLMRNACAGRISNVRGLTEPNVSTFGPKGGRLVLIEICGNNEACSA